MKNRITIVWPNGCRKRTLASINGAGGDILQYGLILYTDNDVIDDLDEPKNPDKKWIQLPDKWYIATRYPSSDGVERAQVEVNNEPPPGSPDTVTVTVQTSDGKSGSATITLK